MCSPAYSQQFAIKGVVKDSSHAIAYASVTLRNNHGKIIDGVITKNNGKFSLVAPQGNYSLLISFIGYIPIEKEISIKEDTHLGVIRLKKKLNALKEVIITAPKQLITRKVDRLVFNVGQSVSAVGGDAIDALKATPGVHIQNDKIGIVGKSTVTVYINDRKVHLSGKSLINYLHSISAADLKNIEVIMAPPAKYEAEGNSGIININFKETRKNSWNNDIRIAYIQTTYPSYSLGNTFRYNKNKFSFVTSITAKKGDKGGDAKMKLHYPNQLWIGKDEIKKQQDNYSIRFNANYALSQKASLGALLLWNQSYPDNYTNSKQDIFKHNKLYSSILTESDKSEKNQNFAINLNYNQELDTLGRKLALNLSYFNYIENTSNDFTSLNIANDGAVIDQLIADNTGNLNIDNFSVKLDFEHPFSWAKFNYGAKTAFTTTDSDIAFYNLTSGHPVIVSNKTNRFSYSESILSLYASAIKSFGKQWKVKLGLRYEWTNAKGHSEKVKEKVDFTYGKLFPTVYVLYKINSSNVLSFSYSRRINRPSFWELNPFRYYINENSYVEGNPFLQPMFNDNFRVTYGYNHKWFSTFFTRFITDGYGQIPLVNSNTHQQILTRKNYYSGKVFGLVESYSFNAFDWLDTHLQATGIYTKNRIYQEYQNLTPVEPSWGFFGSINNTIIFNSDRTIIGEVNYNYISPLKQTVFDIESRSSLDIGIKFLLFNKDLQIALNAYDVLKTNAQDVSTETNGIKQYYHTYNDSRYFRVSLRYRFGNENIEVKNNDFGNEAERDRL